jgi:hypothetical protein
MLKESGLAVELTGPLQAEKTKLPAGKAVAVNPAAGM